MRIVAGLMAIVFAGFGIVQYNDPDGVLWAVIYATPALVSLVVALGRVPLGLPALALTFSAGFAYLAPELFQRDWIESEVGRESAGLLIAAIWFFALMIAQRKNVVGAE